MTTKLWLSVVSYVALGLVLVQQHAPLRPGLGKAGSASQGVILAAVVLSAIVLGMVALSWSAFRHHGVHHGVVREAERWLRKQP